MAIIQALLALLTRSAGKILNAAFGWATVMLFGQVPQKRQIYLSLIAFGSVVWIVALAGVLEPSVATFLFVFVTVPPWLDKRWIRLGMIAAVAVIPGTIGWLSTRLVDTSEPPRGVRPFARVVLKGYPFTLGLALTLIVMTIFAPIVKLRALARGWTTHHVPVIVKPEDYPDVVSDVQRALRAGGLETEPRPASWMLRMPTKLLALFARSTTAPLMADFLTTLVAPGIEVLVHPADIVIMGSDFDAARARAILAEHLTYSKAYLTWTKEANQIEEQLGALWRSATSVASTRRQLAEIDRQLRSLKLSYEEWEILFRQRLLVDRQLSGAAPLMSPEAPPPADSTARATAHPLARARRIVRAGLRAFTSALSKHPSPASKDRHAA
jgi:hypothetical protein